MREEKEGRYLLWMPKKRRALLWVPLADHCGGLREESLARLLWTYAVSEICRIFRAHHLPTVMVDPVRASYVRHQTCQE